MTPTRTPPRTHPGTTPRTTPRTAEALLRQAVLDHREAEPRVHPPARLHVGVPGTPHPVLPAGPPPPSSRRVRQRWDGPDLALRTDLVAGLLHQCHEGRREEGSRRPLVWLARAGQLTWHDLDADWFAATVAACGQVGLPPWFVVVTRSGWWEPLSDRTRTWKRLRRT